MKDRESRRLEKKSPTSKVGVTELKVKNRCEDWKISTEKFSVYSGNRTRDIQLRRRARYPYATTTALKSFFFNCAWLSVLGLKIWNGVITGSSSGCVRAFQNLYLMVLSFLRTGWTRTSLFRWLGWKRLVLGRRKKSTRLRLIDLIEKVELSHN